MINWLYRLYRRHYAFLLVFLLFVTFRLMAILLFRPGGFVTDASDYDFYYTWGQLTPMGYRAYDNLWTAYPPLFPTFMLPIFELSSRIPPWVEPRFFFHLLFGMALLVFESGNLVWVYRLAGKLRAHAPAAPRAPEDAPFPRQHIPIPPDLFSAILYALLFVPVYTLTGWFEPLPLFFLLWGLDLLLSPVRGSWIASATVAALGFLTKLTPVLLVPVAIRWLGARLSWQAARAEWFNPRADGNLIKPALYTAIFAGVVVGVGYPLASGNPELIFSSLRVQSIRPPWQSVWALIDGFYEYGLVPLDMRNLQGLSGPLWETRLPWMWIGIAFAVVYLWLYTRRYEWSHPRTPMAFTAASIILLFLYSKGWSPQFLVWIVVFVVLLLPTLRGMALASLLTVINFVEAYLFLLMLPGERWIMWGTVLVRTTLLLLLMVEFLGQIVQRYERGILLRRAAGIATWLVMGVAVVGAVVSVPRAAQAYTARRLAEHPCQEVIGFLRAEAGGPNRTIISQQPEVWRDLYPWLRTQYTIRILDGYSPDTDPVRLVLDRLEQMAHGEEFWWIERSDVSFSDYSPAAARSRYFERGDVHVLEERTMGACHLYRVIRLEEDAARARVDVAGGPVVLKHVALAIADPPPAALQLGEPEGPEQDGPDESASGESSGTGERAGVGKEVRLVLYWQADAPVEESYTVFTQLFRMGADAVGEMVAQQDNLPVQGLAPTDTWQTGALIRDPYRLVLPPDIESGVYRLFVGMYHVGAGGQIVRQTLTFPDGTAADHLALPVEIP